MILVLLALAGPELEAQQADLQLFSGAALIEDSSNDADSFLVEAGGQRFRIRLYFVDAPESAILWDADVRRVREQMRYFGLPDERTVLDYGRRAAEFTRQQLTEPFEVATAFAAALGRSGEKRIYGFVRTARGQDLAERLVQEGLARPRGVGRETPEGTSQGEVRARLQDLEAAAMLKRAGIWASADSDRLPPLRAEQREEDGALKSVRTSIEQEEQPEYPFDINTAEPADLQRVKGIGPALARRIIEGRPYSSLEDLLKLRGVSTNQLNAWSEFLVAR